MFHCENVKVVIHSYRWLPGHYDRKIAETLRRERPAAFRVRSLAYCESEVRSGIGMPAYQSGAARKFGFHTVRTAARFEINGERIENLELIELEK